MDTTELDKLLKYLHEQKDSVLQQHLGVAPQRATAQGAITDAQAALAVIESRDASLVNAIGVYDKVIAYVTSLLPSPVIPPGA